MTELSSSVEMGDAAIIVYNLRVLQKPHSAIDAISRSRIVLLCG